MLEVKVDNVCMYVGLFVYVLNKQTINQALKMFPFSEL